MKQSVINGSDSPSSLGIGSPATPGGATSEEEKQRKKREKLEAWKKAQAAKKAAAAINAKTPAGQATAAAASSSTTSSNVPATNGFRLPSKSIGHNTSRGSTHINLPIYVILTGGLPGKPAFALPSAAISRIGLPPKPGSSSRPSAGVAVMDDSDTSDRKLQKLALPPVDPLVLPGLGGVAPVTENLEADYDDDDEDAMDVDSHPTAPVTQGEDDDEEDPLDAFMKSNVEEVKRVDKEDEEKTGVTATSTRLQNLNDIDEDENEEDEDGEGKHGPLTPEEILALAAKKARKKDLPAPSHDKIEYEPFRKAFYVPSQDVLDMTEEQVELMRIEMEGIKIRGRDCPRPVRNWGSFGLPAGCYDVIKRLGYAAPTPIQAQAIPAIMSGRDIIGVAKTGSGKTIAFLLPMFRHIKDQRPLESGEGPLALIMTPTRELATQIWRESKPFMAKLGMRAVCAYGGSNLSEQIADMKKGAEVVVCTPGRMIDLLTANSGRVTNLRRTTYLVLDEADRMFDMGFEPQVMKIINNIRPDRQTVLFSATFPQKMDALARKILHRPLEITVGGRSVVAKEIDQRVEIRTPETKFVRLLEILGEMGELHKDEDDFRTLIFVERQESADDLFKELMKKGYISSSLHGGKDQVDRDETIADFKAGFIPIVIATSVAARGLDVKELKLVVNYDCPNHMEDYVHRAGRTGRAGQKGVCITFITPDQERYSLDILRALQASEAYIPPELQALADGFLAKVKSGSAKTAGSGFGGKGLDKFESERESKDRAQRSAYGEEGSIVEKPKASAVAEKGKSSAEAGSGAGANAGGTASGTHTDPHDSDYTFSNFNVEIVKGPAPERVAAAAEAKPPPSKPATISLGQDAPTLPPQTLAALARAEAAGNNVKNNLAAAVAKITAGLQKTKTEKAAAEKPAKKDPDATDYHAIVPINDYPQKARWKATNKEQMVQLQDLSGASITMKGNYYEPGKEPGPNQEPKLHLLIESNDEYRVRAAVDELRRVLLEASVAALQTADRDGQPAGRYRV